MNAPRVLQEVEGDFVLEVRVTGTFEPGDQAIAERLPYHAAGLLLMKDEQTYVRLERAAMADGGQAYPYANFELREDGQVSRFGRTSDAPLEEGRGTLLRMERHGAKIRGAVSQDGTTWVDLEAKTVALPKKLRVGLLPSTHQPGTSLRSLTILV